jgi:hypothetical protein
MFESKSDGVAGEWMRLCEELYNLNSSINNIREIKSRNTRRERHVTRMGKVKVRAGFWRRGLNEDSTWQTCVQVSG